MHVADACLDRPGRDSETGQDVDMSGFTDLITLPDVSVHPVTA